MFKLAFKFIIFLIKILILVTVIVVATNLIAIKTTDEDIVVHYNGDETSIPNTDLVELSRIEPDCIMVLGASVLPNGSPSPVLRDRLDTAIALYFKGVAPKLLLSGDDGQLEYNEVQTMIEYVTAAGVPREDIFLDHAGFSTYDSVYRANYIFGVESMVVVTQEYHMYRALYGCKRMKIDALGASADQNTVENDWLRDDREALATTKDFFKWLVKPEATLLGEAIPISGSGTSTQ